MEFAYGEQFADTIQRELAGTRYACTALEELSRGSSNYTFEGILTTPLDDGTAQVVVKHTQDHRAASPEVFMPPSRCLVEKESLEVLTTLPPTPGPCIVRAPKLLYFIPKSNTQVLEFLPDSVDLKYYMLKHFSAPNDASKKPLCDALGHSIGTWLRSFHQWATLPGQNVLRDIAETNKAVQKHHCERFYERLVDIIADYPSILEEERGILETIRDEEVAALRNPDQLQVVHGDFWTGKYGSPTMDLGRMIAELYQIYFFMGIKEARWLITAIINGYGHIDDKFAFRTAVHIGARMINFGTLAGDLVPETRLQRGIRMGREMIVHARREDRGWFEAGDLACLFAGRD
ncbi:kinase-like domain-containing protein [Rhypophila decipiens]|uniref:Kinase-like domain-containing protein n=1 Tax=Rhypophila decipiens TaxID=261697 RepID=A0AAN6YCB0_9PEZI|nr:kinase-like domain-containing protein [Rhypophila decipiens]